MKNQLQKMDLTCWKPSMVFSRRELFFWIFIGVLSVILAFGYGYFLGRYEQIELNKSILQTIPDVNCS